MAGEKRGADRRLDQAPGDPAERARHGVGDGESDRGLRDQNQGEAQVLAPCVQPAGGGEAEIPRPVGARAQEGSHRSHEGRIAAVGTPQEIQATHDSLIRDFMIGRVEG